MRLLASLRVRPDVLTILGSALSVGVAVLFAWDYVRLAGAAMLFAGLFDALDGAVARESGRPSRFGAFLDSTLDRVSEGAVFVGILYLYAASDRPTEALLAGAAMLFSFSTSYARARAEGLGIACEVGLLERAGRVVILALAALADLLTLGLALVALGALVTTIQRVFHVRRETLRETPRGGGGPNEKPRHPTGL